LSRVKQSVSGPDHEKSNNWKTAKNEYREEKITGIRLTPQYNETAGTCEKIDPGKIFNMA
jgi:hypothetical protein